jgi:Arc/MetJ-type ribon-helix-helix transcriptional regulator
MSEQVAIRIPAESLAGLDAAVLRGRFPTRAAAVRAAIEMLLRVEREREIAAEYRRAYGTPPQEDWVGEAGLRLGADYLAREATEND